MGGLDCFFVFIDWVFLIWVQNLLTTVPRPRVSNARGQKQPWLGGRSIPSSRSMGEVAIVGAAVQGWRNSEQIKSSKDRRVVSVSQAGVGVLTPHPGKIPVGNVACVLYDGACKRFGVGLTINSGHRA